MRKIEQKDIATLESGDMLILERGVVGKPGYEKMVFLFDSPGAPYGASMSATAVENHLRNRYVVTVAD